jgi:hypothetical protein
MYISNEAVCYQVISPESAIALGVEIFWGFKCAQALTV